MDLSAVGGGIFKERTLSDELLLDFRFAVFFFVGGVVPNPLDIRFQKVSGLSVEVTTEDFNEGGQNLHQHRLPQRMQHGNLTLERGMVVGSPLNVEFNVTMSTFKFLASNVLVTLFNEHGVPVSGWLFMKAYPVKWSTSDLDASRIGPVIDTMELAYSRMQPLRI